MWTFLRRKNHTQISIYLQSSILGFDISNSTLIDERKYLDIYEI